MENKPDILKPPRILYQYRPPELWALANLFQRVIYFGSPEKFNDPYDCNIGLGIKHLMATDFADMSRDLLSAGANMLSFASKDDAAHIVNDIFPAALGKVLGESIRVACFSARKDNLLMWSRYAGRGEGFCLAFDVQSKPFFVNNETAVFTIPVNYTKKIIGADGIKVWQGALANLLAKLPVHKSVDWRYEKEWRMITYKGVLDEKEYHEKSLKAVYFGAEIKRNTKELVCSIVKEKYPHAKLWQGRLSKTEYKVEFDPIS